MDSVLQYIAAADVDFGANGHNPCFNGQCFAIELEFWVGNSESCHNPCFNGQCFAIKTYITLHVT